jgi:ribosome maturation factor RimP
MLPPTKITKYLEVGQTRFFYCHHSMTHPLVPQIWELATPIARELGLEVVEVWMTANG